MAHPYIGFLFYKFKGHKYPVFAHTRSYESEFVSSWHCHDFPQIWYCRSGKHTHIVGDREIECGKGSVVIIPAGVYHEFRVEKGETCEIMDMHLSYEMLLGSAPESFLNTFSNLYLPLFQEELGFPIPLHRILSHQSQADMEESLSWLSMLTFAVEGMVQTEQIYEKVEKMFSIEEFAVPEGCRKKAANLLQSRIYPVMRVISYMNLHYPDKITEETILEACGISRSSLYRYFKKVVGHTYCQYLQQLRVRRAYFYIKYTTYSISYISDVCGFFDVHHMSRLFTKYIGESPRQRRNRLRQCTFDNP